MDRQQAMELVKSKVKNKNLIKHMLAVEACMIALAEKFGEDASLWGMAGLLHDLDYDQTVNDFSKHGVVSSNLLQERGVDERIIYAIKAHSGHVEAKSIMDKALYAVDPLTGLIVAAALMHPSKKLVNIDTGFVMNRFKEKRFAAGANREQIKSCQQLGLELEEFCEICLKAMQGISKELNL